MRKRTVNHLADTLFWYLIYFLPVLAYLTYLIAEPSNGTTIISFNECFENIGLGFTTNNIIVNTLKDIFGTNGVLPIFSTNTPFEIFGWFICTYITHLAVDFILFIPRICHKYMERFTQKEE